MAERVEVSIAGRTHSRKAYPWNDWGDGSTWKLKQGEDYFVPDTSFRGVVYAAAATRGMRAKTQSIPGGMLIQFVPVTLPVKKKLRPRKAR